MRYLMVLVAALVVGCSGGGGSQKKLDGPTYGAISIAVDESLKPLIDAEVKAFEGIYTNASITPL
jgi:phosphate transport system substrate-binding protein